MSAQMPRRPRQHVVEEASRKAFLQLIPNEWATSPVVKDYGVDERVEIFDGGFATALGFWAQLKGTDELDLNKALREPFAVSTLKYMSAQVEPVLLVCHHGPSDRLFGAWLHRRNIVIKNADQKTVTFRWTLADELTVKSPEELHQEARRFRLFRARLEGGLTVRTAVSQELSCDQDTLMIALESFSRRAGRFLRFNDVDSPPDVAINISHTELFVDMSVVSFGVRNLPAETVDDIARNVLLLAAACLSKLGRPDAAIDIVTLCRDAPAFLADELALTLVASFSQAKRWRDAIDILSDGSRAGFSEPFATLLMTSLFLDAQLPEAEACYVAEGLLERARLLNEVGRTRDAAGLCYSAGNLFFHTAYDYAQALLAYEQAAVLLPSYCDQDYYCAELASAYFENERYSEAVHWYEEAHRRNPRDRTLLAKQADAHAYSGAYEVAQRLFNDFATDASNEDSAIWSLKLTALEVVLRLTGTPWQQRRPDAALHVIEQEGVSGIENAWKLDGLCPSAWSALVGLESGSEVLTDALLVLCCFSMRGFDEPWPFLILLTHASQPQALFNTVVQAAWSRRGESLVEDLLTIITDLEEPIKSALLAAFILEIERLRSINLSATVRLVGDDESRDILEVEINK